MPRLFSLQLLLLSFFLNSSVNGFAQKFKNSFYADTVVQLDRYSVVLTHVYNRKNLFFKANITINNGYDQFMILDPKHIYIQPDGGEKTEIYSGREKIIDPQTQKKFTLRFNGRNLNKDKMILDVRTVRLTDQIIAQYSPFQLPIETKIPIFSGPLTVEVLKITREPNCYKIRIRIKYTGDHLLKIAFDKIKIRTKDGDVIYNTVKPNHRRHWEPGTYKELATLRFFMDSNTKVEKSIFFEDVFFDYSSVEVEGFKIPLYKIGEPSEEELKNIEKESNKNTDEKGKED